MSGLDPGARGILEELIDLMLQEPSNSETSYRALLEAMGITASLETVLSYMSGLLEGALHSSYLINHHRLANYEEKQVFVDLFKRRSRGLREAFMNTRLDPDS